MYPFIYLLETLNRPFTPSKRFSRSLHSRPAKWGSEKLVPLKRCFSAQKGSSRDRKKICLTFTHRYL